MENERRARNSKECPACGTAMRTVSFWIDACPACDYMKSSLTPGAGAPVEGIEYLRRRNFEALLDRLSHHTTLKDARLLEPGCGKGWFLEAAKRRGMIVHGIEPGPDGAVARNSGFSVDTGFFPQDLCSKGPFDVITFNDVFEHLPDPTAAIVAVERLLADDGILVLNLPSSHGIFFRVSTILNGLGWSGPYERLWQRGLSSPHMSYFNTVNLVSFVHRHTALRFIDQSSLRSISRDGLRERIKVTIPSWRGDAMFAAVWLASFALTTLPPDIAVVMFRKEGSTHSANSPIEQ
jgi:2-polyprenyl-3-methyl-5-hydroxy-6-metoxy-1,4-benzoquinol methylase